MSSVDMTLKCECERNTTNREQLPKGIIALSLVTDANCSLRNITVRKWFLIMLWVCENQHKYMHTLIRKSDCNIQIKREGGNAVIIIKWSTIEIKYKSLL